MEKQDYYHEIAVHAREIADLLEGDARAAASNDGTISPDDVNDNIKSRASLRSEHSAFEDDLEPLWMEGSLDLESATAMAEIIEASDHQFRPKVGGRPETVLKRAAAATVEADIRDGVNEILRDRVVG